MRLRVVGGLADLRQYTQFEEPFWTNQLPRLTGGRVLADIVPLEQAGFPGGEMLRLLQSGVVTFGTVVLPLTMLSEPAINAGDLPGLNTDMGTLRKTTASFRPVLTDMLRERHGVELLALYTYPAQALFCRRPLTSLADLRGRRVRVSNVGQADFMLALGAMPVVTSLSELPGNLRRSNVDCGVTGTMSGYTIGLHQYTTHLHTMPLGWGMSAFAVNRRAWVALPGDVQALLRQELARLEQSIWQQSERETEGGVACNGTGPCAAGPPGGMTVVRTTPLDDGLRRRALKDSVLPRWRERCDKDCDVLVKTFLQPLLDALVP